MRGEDQIDLQARQSIQRRQKLAQGIAILMPANVWRDVFEHLVARKQHTPLAPIEAHVTRRMPRCPDHFEFSDRRRDLLASPKKTIGLEPVAPLPPRSGTVQIESVLRGTRHRARATRGAPPSIEAGDAPVPCDRDGCVSEGFRGSPAIGRPQPPWRAKALESRARYACRDRRAC